MKKISPNSLCPCGSKSKYKKCCQVYHKGANPKTALLLMRSRYCAFSLGDSAYIIKTTHENNEQYMSDTKAWKQSIDEFSEISDFLALEILKFKAFEKEAFVTFKAKLSTGDMTEQSRFLKVENRWLYESGIVS